MSAFHTDWRFVNRTLYCVRILALVAHISIAHATTNIKSCRSAIFQGAPVKIHNSTFQTYNFGAVTVEVELKGDANTEIENRPLYDYLAAAAESAALVWHKAFESRKTIKIVFGSRIKDSEFAALYENGVIYVGVVSLAASLQGVPLLHKTIIACAHEATHLVQESRGEKLKPSRTNTDYFEDAHEIEAWKTSLDVLKAFDPGCNGVITWGTHDFAIPLQTTYHRSLLTKLL